MKNLILLFFVMFLVNFTAKGIELKELSIEYEAAIGTNRQAYSYEEHGDKKGELNLEMKNEYKRVYSIVRIESDIAESQFSNIALDTELGISWKPVDVYIQHRSEHVLDAQVERNYPNENSFGVRVKLLQ